MKTKLNKLLLILFVTITLIISSFLPAYAENNFDNITSIEKARQYKESIITNNSINVELDNITIDSIEIIIHGLFLATISYLIIKSDKKRYH